MNFCRVRMNGQTEDAVSILQDTFSVFSNFFLWCVKIFTDEVLVIVLDVSPSSSLPSFFPSLSFFLSRSHFVFAVTLKRFFPLHFFLNKLTIVVMKKLLIFMLILCPSTLFWVLIRSASFLAESLRTFKYVVIVSI